MTISDEQLIEADSPQLSEAQLIVNQRRELREQQIAEIEARNLELHNEIQEADDLLSDDDFGVSPPPLSLGIRTLRATGQVMREQGFADGIDLTEDSDDSDFQSRV